MAWFRKPLVFFQRALLLGKIKQYDQLRYLNCMGDTTEMNGLVLGVFTKDDDPYHTAKVYTKVSISMPLLNNNSN